MDTSSVSYVTKYPLPYPLLRLQQNPPSPSSPPNVLHYTKVASSSHSDVEAPDGTITRSEVVNVYILSPSNSANVNLPTIKDVSILAPKQNHSVLCTDKRRKISYYFHKSVMNDRKKVQSRRDAEVVRVKKHLLRQYLSSIGERKDVKKSPPSKPR